jgi:hypothetical protein
MHFLTVAHFTHIWMLHGIQFSLIDGVLALHLHSAVSAAAKKIAERRHLNRVARELNGRFEDATDLELRKAAASGDVCCICLANMNTAAQVKKVGCGHLYHIACLREVVERARSLETARCPLCRAGILDGRQPEVAVRNMPTAQPGIVPHQGGLAAVVPDHDPQHQGARENEPAIFRFSTEELVPAWLPIPAFSFEIVRRPALEANDALDIAAVQGGAPPAPGAPRLSAIRRLLILAGAIPMSAEEEQVAVEQLVDMFPQYDRSDLLTELRRRGSAEAVAESVIVGSFAGVARGQEWHAATGAAAVNNGQ